VKKLPIPPAIPPKRNAPTDSPRRSTRARRRLLLAGLLGTLAVSALLAVAALAAATLTVKSAANSTLGKTVVVNPAGRTLYSLSGESSHRLLCKSSECAHFWPPLIVPSRTTHLKDGTGVHGTLGLIRRANGSLQVTLRGKPLYRFSGDHSSGQANGEGIRSFGGTWHAVTASATVTAPPPVSPTPPMSPPSTPPYGY
jgi:predicted lipoprotein with Yx(FWY)xxD motif